MRRKPVDPIQQTSTEAILESISDGVFTVDLNWHVTSFNRAAEVITGIPRKTALGRPCCEVFRSSMCEAECALRKTMRTGKPVINRAAFIINAERQRIPVSVSTAVLRDSHGQVIGGAETFRDLGEIEALRLELSGRSRVGELTSRSASMQRVLGSLPAIASSSSTVLILGETGTGKELVARTIHEQSPRRKGPFVAVHCGALPDTLLESELFGYKVGAFTGAVQNKPGRFSQAQGGTLFLDEIGEVSPALQVRLLRVLQERVFEPLGSTRSEKADVRIVAATHRNLEDLVHSGAFREDLFYRINVVRIELPPLRRRPEDIPVLVEQFIQHFNHLQGKSINGLAPLALDLLLAYDWPGNIRELENVIERAFLLSSSGVIGVELLPPEFNVSRGKSMRGVSFKASRQMAEARSIREALRRHHGNRTRAAEELGIHRSTLLRKLPALGIASGESLGRPPRKSRKV